MPSSRSGLSRLCLSFAVAAAVTGPAVVGSVASAQEVEDGWPMVGRDPSHGGVLASGPRAPYRTAWTAEVPEGVRGGAVIADGTVVVVGATEVTAFDAASGEERWRVSRSGGPAGSPAVAGEVVVHASGRGKRAAVVARGLDDGRERWRAFTGAAPLGGPAVDGTTIVIGLRSGVVLALDVESGEERWRYRADGRVETSPAVADGRVIAVSENFGDGTVTIHALDAESGQRTWRNSPQGVAIGASSPSIAGDTVIVGLGNGNVLGLAARTGGERWTHRAPGAQFGGQVFGTSSVPAAGEGVIISDIAHVERLDPATGDSTWSFRDERWGSAAQHLLLETSPAVSGDTVIVGDGSGAVTAIDAGSGVGVWTEDVGEGAVGPVAVSEEVVVIALHGEEGGVVALESDPEGTRTATESATALSPLGAVGNFLLAFLGVGAAILVVFRYVPLASRDRPDTEEAG